MSSYGFLRSHARQLIQQPTVGDVLRGKSGALPDLVHTHPSETVRDAIGILREYGVSQMPVVGAEPPGDGRRGGRQRVRARMLSAVFEAGRTGRRRSEHMSPPLPISGPVNWSAWPAKTLRDSMR